MKLVLWGIAVFVVGFAVGHLSIVWGWNL